MKFGVREICDVVLKAKANQKVGNKTFYKGEPVIYFDTLKTSSMEGAATTVYAQGGRGNSRLMAWEGERTVTFTMEDALISPAGFMILSGAGLIEASDENVLPIHVIEQTDKVTVATDGDVTITLDQMPSADPDASIYVMLMKDGEINTEPYIAEIVTKDETINSTTVKVATKQIKIAKAGIQTVNFDGRDTHIAESEGKDYTAHDIGVFTTGCVVMVDYYTDKKTGAFQIDITPDKFGGNYYLEASTLFRDTNGVDMPAEFIIPNCKIQSNFTFTMASSGDPSTFTFTMDAFPDYTRFNKTKKVLAAIQVINETEALAAYRDMTNHNPADDKLFDEE